MIINHPKPRFKECRVVECDFCRKMAQKWGYDAGDAADEARREGFRLVPGAKLSDPMKWSCGCQLKNEAKK